MVKILLRAKTMKKESDDSEILLRMKTMTVRMETICLSLPLQLSHLTFSSEAKILLRVKTMRVKTSLRRKVMMLKILSFFLSLLELSFSVILLEFSFLMPVLKVS